MAVEGEAVKGRRWGVWFRKLARLSSWLLLVSVAVLVFSGWGITQTGVIYDITGGLIDRATANTIHRVTVLPLSIFFLMHVFINIGLGITSRYSYVKQIINWALLALGASILALVVYMEYFRLGG